MGFSLQGFMEVLKHETSFKIEIFFFIFFLIIIPFFPVSFISKWILALSMFIILIAEMFNSSIERLTDLVTNEYSELAKHAKDAAAAGVMLSATLTGCIWVAVIIYEISKN